MQAQKRGMSDALGFAIIFAGFAALALFIGIGLLLNWGPSSAQFRAQEIANATATANAPLDPIMCDGTVMGPGDTCNELQGGQSVGSYTYEQQFQQEGQAKQNAEQEALSSLQYACAQNCWTPFPGLILLAVGLLLALPAILLYRRHRRRQAKPRAS